MRQGSFELTAAIRIPLCALMVAALGVGHAQAQALTSEQQLCSIRVNQRVTGIAAALGKQFESCVRDWSRGRLPSGDIQTFEQCREAVSNLVDAKARSVAAADDRHCSDPRPPYGWAQPSDVTGSVINQTIFLQADLLGLQTEGAVVLGTSDPIGARCQQMIQRDWGLVLERKLQEFSFCKKSGFGSGAVNSAATLEACMDTMQADSRGEVAKALGRLSNNLTKFCQDPNAPVNIASVFPGSCSGAGANLATCVNRRVDCRVCNILNTADNLDRDCDLFDDGTSNNSCRLTATHTPPGSTTTTTTTSSTTTTTIPVCGDGIVSPSEDCEPSLIECCNATTCEFLNGDPCTDDGNTCTDNICDGQGRCIANPNSVPCDDGVFCNGTDTCSGGSCSIHTGNPCVGGDQCNDQCNEVDDTCAETNTFCSDGNFCNGSDRCSNGSCSVHNGNPCRGPDSDADCQESCDETSDTCTANDSDGAACDDGNPCTVSDTCTAGVCAGTAKDCSGLDDQCNDGTCNILNGRCEKAPKTNGTSCDDGLFCSSGDICVNGSCSGQTATCDSYPDCQNICNETADSCNEPVGTPCDDEGEVCTSDVCDGSGTCTHVPNTVACDDGVFCNGTDTCSGGTCSVHAGDPCPGADNDSDCSETCDENADACSANDSDGAACDDGDPCTENDQCGSGVCAGTPKDCSAAGDQCNDGVCNATTGACEPAPVSDGTSCDDTLFCTGNADTCQAGVCTGSGSPCDGPDADANCQESCNEATDTCDANDPEGASCDDGLFCTTVSQCQSGTCVGAGDPCAGGDQCNNDCNETTDTCAETGTPCTDNLFCNGTDTCNAGSCTTHSGDPCPGPDGDGNCAESCNEAADNCLLADTNGSACDDGFFCNGNDTCSAGSCTTHAGDPCAGFLADGDANCSEACNESADNCTAAEVDNAACSDGLFCNGSDRCLAGACTVHNGDPCPGADGDNDCSEVCNEASDNCTANDPDGSACASDGDDCTFDQCSSGSCEHPFNTSVVGCDPRFASPSGSGTQCSRSAPCSLVTALGQVDANEEVRLADGTYSLSNELTSVPNNVGVVGGWDGSWNETNDCTGAHLFRNASNPDGSANQQRIVAVQLSGASGFSFECLRISTANATGNGMSTYGVHLTNSSNYSFTDVTIQAGSATAGAGGSTGATGSGGSNGGGGQGADIDGTGDHPDGGAGGAGGGAGAGTAGTAGFNGNGGGGGTSTNSRAGGGGGGGGAGQEGSGSTGGCGGGVSGVFGTQCGGRGGGGGCDAGANPLGCVGNSGSDGSSGSSGGAGAGGALGSNGSRTSGFWVPGGQGAAGGNGQGGQGGAGGGGGGGQQGTSVDDGEGGGGGGGGGGGQGSVGGTGGLGGGSSYGIFLFNNGSGGLISSSSVSAGGAGGGGTGGGGGGTSNRGNQGGGGGGGSGEVGNGGNGGFGGFGGGGGKGGDGRAGQSVNIVTQGGTAPTVN